MQLKFPLLYVYLNLEPVAKKLAFTLFIRISRIFSLNFSINKSYYYLWKIFIQKALNFVFKIFCNKQLQFILQTITSINFESILSILIYDNIYNCLNAVYQMPYLNFAINYIEQHKNHKMLNKVIDILIYFKTKLIKTKK